MTAPKPHWVLATIAQIEARPTTGETFIPTRYPYTYAYDYLRSHATDFGIDQDTAGSRSATAGWLRQHLGYGSDDPRHLPIVEALADAYMKLWRIERSSGPWLLVIEFEDGDEMSLPVEASVIDGYNGDWDSLFSDMSTPIPAERDSCLGNRAADERSDRVRNFYVVAPRQS